MYVQFSDKLAGPMDYLRQKMCTTYRVVDTGTNIMKSITINEWYDDTGTDNGIV